MCGIGGFYGFRDDRLLKQFSQQLSHRGPDGEGIFQEDNISLLNRRLAIIDIKGGDQPIYNEDKSAVTVYNGEIYNYLDLRGELEKLGHRFTSKSDTETIVHGYEQWGEKCFERLNGMFAIALYDKKNKKLILARDQFGIKPLYFSVLEDSLKILFSSEIKPLFYSGLVDKKPNDRIIYRYLKYRIHDDQRETFFENIYRLLPGEMMTATSAISNIQNQRSKLNIKVKKYSNLENDLLKISLSKKKNLSENDVEQFRRKLVAAVKIRLVSEVPVGTCLSGGLDSSTIAAVANQLLRENQKEARSLGKEQITFSAIFPGQSNNEEKYIDEAIKFVRVESYKVRPSPDEFFNDLDDFIRIQEEPTISTGPYAQYQVMREAHKKVTVLLDGQGSDEMMAGYLPYYFVYLNQLKKEMQYRKLFKEVWESRDIVYKYLLEKVKIKIGLKEIVPVDLLLNLRFANQFKSERFTTTNDNLKKRLIEDIFLNSLQSLLRYEDRNSMRFSIEGRVPFLDFNLLMYIFSLDDAAIIMNGWNKYILRQATKGLLPEEVRKRRNKIGFTTPEKEWFLKMKNRIYSIFMSESFGQRPYWSQAEVTKAFLKFVEGKTDDSMLFWRFLNVELWLRCFFSRQSVKEKPKVKPLTIRIDGKFYRRHLIKTKVFKKGDDYVKIIADHTLQLINLFKQKKTKLFVVVSEKIVAISQGRSYFIWDIKPGFWANLLYRFVRSTPYGIGLGSPWTMQLAIREAGLIRIVAATVISALTKPLGIRGLFYRIAGREVAAIDGPTEYSLYPSNVSAKLGPKDPQKVCKEVDSRIKFKRTSNYLGSVIIDANDIGRNVLGNSTKLDNKLIEQIFADNPMGQADEQTPVCVVERE